MCADPSVPRWHIVIVVFTLYFAEGRAREVTQSRRVLSRCACVADKYTVLSRWNATHLNSITVAAGLFWTRNQIAKTQHRTGEVVVERTFAEHN